ncbi:hypothetical protein [Prosthecobacter sp.]|uniref:hypothetical protein n=1 Tax=Prosthecobacter sp. TaxID=1965333 RepID=UPI003783E9BC
MKNVIRIWLAGMILHVAHAAMAGVEQIEDALKFPPKNCRNLAELRAKITPAQKWWRLDEGSRRFYIGVFKRPYGGAFEEHQVCLWEYDSASSSGMSLLWQVHLTGVHDPEVRLGATAIEIIGSMGPDPREIVASILLRTLHGGSRNMDTKLNAIPADANE